MRTSFILRACILMIAVSASMFVAAASPVDLVDPTRPLGYLTPDLTVQSDLVLSSVMITQSSRLAVINGQRVVEGQLIGDAKVISIKPGRVILRRGDRNLELKVHQNNVKHLTVEHAEKKVNL